VTAPISPEAADGDERVILDGRELQRAGVGVAEVEDVVAHLGDDDGLALIHIAAGDIALVGGVRPIEGNESDEKVAVVPSPIVSVGGHFPRA